MPRAVDLRYVGTGSAAYNITTNASWLSVSPTSGTTTGEHVTVTVNYNTTGLTLGVSTALITVTAPGASNSPLQIPVELHALAPNGDDDHDGLINADEFRLGTDPLNPDTDGDGMKDGDEVRAGTCPTNQDDCLKFVGADRSINALRITWRSASNVSYSVDRATNLMEGFSPLFSNIVTQPPTNLYLDVTATDKCPYFYRVRTE